jgi:hypothetical protein
MDWDAGGQIIMDPPDPDEQHWEKNNILCKHIGQCIPDLGIKKAPNPGSGSVTLSEWEFKWDLYIFDRRDSSLIVDVTHPWLLTWVILVCWRYSFMIVDVTHPWLLTWLILDCWRDSSLMLGFYMSAVLSSSEWRHRPLLSGCWATDIFKWSTSPALSGSCFAEDIHDSRDLLFRPSSRTSDFLSG